jgi:MFS transporter, DHA1 family, multidrug resistance protein
MTRAPHPGASTAAPAGPPAGTPCRVGVRASLVLLVVVAQASLAAFVPAVPHVAADLGTSTTVVDRTMALYMGGYAVSMAVAGFLAQRVGLRRVQLGALLLHAAASVAVAAAPDPFTLATARVVQALGGGAGTVLARVYVQEVFAEHERLPVLTQLSTAIAITPAVTPPLAGLLVDHLSWRPVLASLAGLSLLTYLVARRALPVCTAAEAESAQTSAEAQQARRTRPARSFWWFTAAICLAWCVYFTFTTFSSSTFQVALGTTSTTFGLLYALVVVGYVVGSRAARRLSDRHGLQQMLLLCGVVAVAATAVMAAGTLTAPDDPGLMALLLALPMAVAMVGVGAAFPVCQAGMLRSVGSSNRSASGVFFFLQMTSGAVYTGALSLLDPTTPGALSVAVLAPAVGLMLLVTVGRRAGDDPPSGDERSDDEGCDDEGCDDERSGGERQSAHLRPQRADSGYSSIPTSRKART